MHPFGINTCQWINHDANELSFKTSNMQVVTYCYHSEQIQNLKFRTFYQHWQHYCPSM